MKTNILGLIKPLIPQIVLISIIYLVLLLIPNKNLVSINLAILAPVLLYKLWERKPELKDWAKAIIITICWTSGFLILFQLLYQLSGLWGIFGLIITLILIIAFRIIKGWKLFAYTVNWGANILHGRPEDFDVSKLSPEKKEEEVIK
jgi:amino acid transporter